MSELMLPFLFILFALGGLFLYCARAHDRIEHLICAATLQLEEIEKLEKKVEFLNKTTHEMFKQETTINPEP